MVTINTKEINNKIASLPSRKELSKEQQRQEDDLMHFLGIDQHPKYSDEFQNILKQYILKTKLNIKKQEEKINYLNLFENGKRETNTRYK